MDYLIRRAREALVDVTPGPWSHNGRTGVMAAGSVDTYSGAVWGTIIRAEQLSEMDGDGRSWECSGDPVANAGFIAAARDLVPAMAARLEAQDALLRWAMAWLADFAEAKFDAVQTHRASHPADEPDPVTDAETVWAYQDDARATLAKLRAHLEGQTND